YSDNDHPNSSGIHTTMPISLGTLLISLVALVIIAFAAAVIWIEIINPRRTERAHRNNLVREFETIHTFDTSFIGPKQWDRVGGQTSELTADDMRVFVATGQAIPDDPADELSAVDIDGHRWEYDNRTALYKLDENTN
ncbi:MAG: hypothetical protein V7694_26370, partial [Rhodococcus sp. (in: high G+C Gram-positive bacteria)]